jgi:hypothetical protein
MYHCFGCKVKHFKAFLQEFCCKIAINFAIKFNVAMDRFNKFLTVNKLRKSAIAEHLGVSNAFITQICSGARKLPDDKLALIIANPDWDTNMLTDPKTPATDQPMESTLVSYLERKVGDQEVLIRELYQQIGMLEAKLDLARKGEIAGTADGSLSASAV